MNYEGLQNQRQNIRKYLSGKKTFSTDSLLIARQEDHMPAFDYDTQSIYHAEWYETANFRLGTLPALTGHSVSSQFSSVTYHRLKAGCYPTFDSIVKKQRRSFESTFLTMAIPWAWFQGHIFSLIQLAHGDF